jgi:hypothetical protein
MMDVRHGDRTPEWIEYADEAQTESLERFVDDIWEFFAGLSLREEPRDYHD